MKQSDGSSVALLIVMLRPSTTKNIRKSRKHKKDKLKGRTNKRSKNRSDKGRLVKEIGKIGVGFRRKKRKGDEENHLSKNHLSPYNHQKQREGNSKTLIIRMMRTTMMNNNIKSVRQTEKAKKIASLRKRKKMTKLQNLKRKKNKKRKKLPYVRQDPICILILGT